jgi:predicted DNA-binding protein (MmcQ/YjbR family)
VRYVKLLPGLGDDIIDCDIFEASTNDAVPYTALSYAWGPISNSISIRCSGTRYLTVRSNLYQALWHIRHPVESRIMWVDAICINQGDVSERNHQVAQMTQVYSQAEKLFIWLGRESDEKAVNLIVSLSKMSKKHRRQPGGVNVQPHLNQQDWKTLRVYLDATWFERVWV